MVVKNELQLAIIIADGAPHFFGPGGIGSGVFDGQLAIVGEQVADVAANDAHIAEGTIVVEAEMQDDFSAGITGIVAFVKDIIPPILDGGDQLIVISPDGGADGVDAGEDVVAPDASVLPHFFAMDEALTEPGLGQGGGLVENPLGVGGGEGLARPCPTLERGRGQGGGKGQVPRLRSGFSRRGERVRSQTFDGGAFGRGFGMGLRRVPRQGLWSGPGEGFGWGDHARRIEGLGDFGLVA